MTDIEHASIDDYDQDTIAYLVASGVSDALLARVLRAMGERS